MKHPDLRRQLEMERERLAVANGEIEALEGQLSNLRAHADSLAGALEKADKTIRSMRNRESLDPNTREHRERERLLTVYRNREE